jgi:hypothetical protein
MEKVATGVPLAQSPLTYARNVNDLADTVGDFKDRRQNGFVGRDAILTLATNFVRAQNSSGDIYAPGDCIQLSNFLLDLPTISRRDLWMDSDVPDDPILEAYAIVAEGILPDEIGLAQIAGACVADVVVVETWHQYAVPTKGQKYLTSSPVGPIEIICLLDAIGEKLLPVRLSVPILSLWGKWQDNVAKSASGTVLISTGHGAWTDSGHSVDDVVNVAEDVSAGDLVNVGMMGNDGVLEGYPRACP